MSTLFPNLGVSRLQELEDFNPWVVKRTFNVPAEEASRYPAYSFAPPTSVEYFLDLLLPPFEDQSSVWWNRHVAIQLAADHGGAAAPLNEAMPGESEWYAVPLARGGWALGRAARVAGPVALTYFFPVRLPALDTWMVQAKDLVAPSAILIHRCRFDHPGAGDVRLLGSCGEWQPDQWPIPTFGKVRCGIPPHCVHFAYTYAPGDLTSPVEFRVTDGTATVGLPVEHQLTLFGVAGYLDRIIE
jgi:hypothetical protein